MEECLIECIDLIKEFLDGKDILYFKNFPFRDLQEEKINKYHGKYRHYKSQDKETGKYHDDSSRLARLIYYVLWGNHEYTDYKLSNLTNADTCFDAGENNFGGDTLITTVAFDGDTTIGNFMVLPKGKASNGKTINQYRGVGSGFKDDFYKFMDILEHLYKKEPVEDTIWQELFENKYNAVFFNSIGNFQNFVEFFMLDGWKELADENKEKMENFDKEKMENFVKQRSEKICERLKKLF